MSRAVAVRAPARIDFGGGWTDVPPYSEEVGGFVCNVAIARYSTVRIRHQRTARAASCVGFVPDADRSLVEAVCRYMELRDVAIDVSNDFPIGAGLGGSSAAGVATVAAAAAWRQVAIGLNDLAETSRTIETRELGIPGGRQDHYAAAYGGALALRFGAGVDVGQVALDVETRNELARRCVIIYTGQSRISGDTITAVIDAYRSGDHAVGFALQRMRELAEEMPATLRVADFDMLGHLVAEQWRHQRSLHPAIPTARIDEIIERARVAGSAGAKALGASGGGCVLVIARKDRVSQVRDAIAPLGELLDYSIDIEGAHRCD